MFGVIVSGRLVQTVFERVGETQFLFNIPDADNVNHVVVFMTGSEPFPVGTAGLVYFSWPDPNAPQTWKLLGHISNAKPSVIYKISQLKKDDVSEHPFAVQQTSHVAQIGVSVEPEANAVAQSTMAVAAPSTMDSRLEFATKMLENFCNYVSSFAVTQSQMTVNPIETYVPLSTLGTWFETFQRRLQQNPYLWRS